MFRVSGYYKEDKMPFTDQLVSETHDDSEEDIFMYGMSEKLLHELRDTNNSSEIVLTQVTRI
jgi:hypothetical protein